MRLLTNGGGYSILRITENPLELIERAGRTAYQSRDRSTEGSAEMFVKKLLSFDPPHESVLEHASMTVEFNDVSRGFSHELVRHRLCSFTQMSTRYVDHSDFCVVVPDGVDADEWLSHYETCYRTLIDRGVPVESARQFLPVGIVTQIVVTANFREWRHIFSLRTSDRSHWEIRGVMRSLLKDVRNCVPVVFDDVGIIE
jgi:thymidylate synthase (FAD)